MQQYYTPGYYQQYQDNSYNPYQANYQNMNLNNQALQLARNNQQVQQQENQGLLWVQGEAGAKAYLVAPNNTVMLMDSEQERFYLKSADSAGMPGLRIFEYKEITGQTKQEQTAADNKDYVTSKDLEMLSSKYEELSAKYEELKSALTVKNQRQTKKKEVQENE